ncbi:MAG: hypothetical protein EA378_11185 [Phycisphaerales bacterium]|nr:MAG: hypothetical protein EA378_11185 [Phycisphaerales bacterium]
MCPQIEPTYARRLGVLCALAGAVCATGVAHALAQGATGQVVANADADASVDGYLDALGLEAVRAATLRARLERAPAEERVAIAESLGGIYVGMLERATTTESRLVVEGLATDLMRRFPGAETSELRVNLQRVQYLTAERLAELHRLRLATPSEVAEAERILRRSIPVFREVAMAAHRRVEVYERRDVRTDLPDDMRAMLDESRRIRSLAMYYAGWSRYYLAYIIDDRGGADEAMDAFGWLLNAPGGRGATLDRLPQGMTRYEHVARAAVGVAMSESLRGQDVTAIRWLDALASGAETPQSVRDALLARRIAVLSAGGRWYDLKALIDRLPTRPDSFRLTVPEARLLAVSAFEGLGRMGDRSASAGDAVLIEAIGQVGLGELVRRGEVSHVLDMVERYGAELIGEDGFVVRFVDGLQSYERARALHADADEPTGEPTSTRDVASAFLVASRALGAALESEDADLFPAQRAECRRLRGLSLYFAGELREAARLLAAAASVSGGDETEAQREEALWFAIVALDRAIRAGDRGATAERDRLATLYLASFPGTERSARLLIGAPGDRVDPQRAVEVLLSIGPSSEVYEAARRRASQLLYRLYRESSGAERAFAASRFTDIASEIFAADVRASETVRDEPEAERATRDAVQVARQMLDVLLGPEVSDAIRAEEVLVSVRELARLRGGVPREIEAELAYRALQSAVVRDHADLIRDRASALRAFGGAFASAGDRLLYNRAVARAAERPNDLQVLREIVNAGVRIAEELRRAPGGLSDAATLGVHDRVADAAARLWAGEDDEAAREIAIELDRRAIDAGQATVRMLRRAGELRESAGDLRGAHDAWRTLMAGTTPGEDLWFEARYESLRLLVRLDAERARAALAQHRVLHPEWGPEPWGERLRVLHERHASEAADGIEP